MFKISKYILCENREQPKGFTMEFDNGNTISVQFGVGNYCQNRDGEPKHYSIDAEIAIWNIKGDMYNFGEDTAKGWCSADEVAKWIHFASTTKI